MASSAAGTMSLADDATSSGKDGELPVTIQTGDTLVVKSIENGSDDSGSGDANEIDPSNGVRLEKTLSSSCTPIAANATNGSSTKRAVESIATGDNSDIVRKEGDVAKSEMKVKKRDKALVDSAKTPARHLEQNGDLKDKGKQNEGIESTRADLLDCRETDRNGTCDMKDVTCKRKGRSEKLKAKRSLSPNRRSNDDEAEMLLQNTKLLEKPAPSPLSPCRERERERKANGEEKGTRGRCGRVNGREDESRQLTADKCPSPPPPEQKHTRSKADNDGSNASRTKREKNEKEHSKCSGGSTIATRQGAASSFGSRGNVYERDSAVSDAAGSRGHNFSTFDASLTPYSSRHAVDTAGAFGSGVSSKEPSFLESLSEEERRTRTRHVPAVEGFKKLHKSEIKRDLKVAKSLFAGVVEDDEAADDLLAASTVESESLTGVEGSDDNISDDTPRKGTLWTFVPPDKKSVNCLHGDSLEMDGIDDSRNQVGTDSASLVLRRAASPRFPHLVESITAFNPPRPPESCAPKKKQRLLRWERNPHEVEIDLTNYKRTVARTRQELHIIESERERVEAVGAALRCHFLNQLKALREESIVVNREVIHMQMQCAEEAELMATRTRSKGCHSMRDVLSVLRTRGEKLQAHIGPDNHAHGELIPESVSRAGIGGTCSCDENATGADLCASGPMGTEPDIVDSTMEYVANGWILPGDTVQTVYGSAVVQKVYGASVLDPNNVYGYTAPSLEVRGTLETKRNVETPAASSSAVAPMTGNNRRMKCVPPLSVESSDPRTLCAGRQGACQQVTYEGAANKHQFPPLHIVPPRVCVRFSFGLAYLQPHHVSLMSDPSAFSDAKLVYRWKEMVNSALLVGGCPDSRTMNSVVTKEGYTCPPGDAAPLDDTNGACQPPKGARQVSASSSQVDDEESMANVEDSASQHDSEKGISAPSENDSNSGSGTISAGGSLTLICKGSSPGDKRRIIPFGGGMLPTPGNRGDPLSKLNLKSLQASLDPVLSSGKGILGKLSNPSVPQDIKDWECQRDELYKMKAKVLTLRNQLYRQRKARIMNERGYAAAHDRSERLEVLLNEMKADLRSLKKRLREELDELGIGEDRACGILASHLKEQNEFDQGLEFRVRRRNKKGLDGVSDVVVRTSRRKAEEAAKNQSREDNSRMGKGNDGLSAVNSSSKSFSTDVPIPKRKRGRGDENLIEVSASNKPKRNYRRQ